MSTNGEKKKCCKCSIYAAFDKKQSAPDVTCPSSVKTGGNILFFFRNIPAGRTVVISDGEVLNLNLMVGLNDTGKFLWEQMGREVTVEELKNALMEEYDVEESLAHKDVMTFIDNLKKNGFLEET